MEISRNIRNKLAFFHLTPETIAQSRHALFEQIHSIVFHGNGGYDWNTVYNMPIWLRKFTLHKMNEYYNPEDETNSSPNSNGTQTLINEDGKIKIPDFLEQAHNKKTSYK